MTETVAGSFERWLRLSRMAFPVPAHATRLSAVFGGVTFVGLLLLFVTGIGLAQFIIPLPEQAYESIQALGEYPLGASLRALHYWIAQAVVLVLLLHLGRVFVIGAYKAPRTATWFVGVILLFVVIMGSYFTGTVLKWDQEGLEALQHYVDVVRRLGLTGVLGSDATGAPLLIRIYVQHIAGWPLVILGLVAVHFYLVHAFNLAPLPWRGGGDRSEVPQEEMTETFWGTLVSILRASAVYYGAAAILALFAKAPLGPAATDIPTGVKPPWPFLWLYGLENLFGLASLLFGVVILVGVLLVVPLLDRGVARHPRNRRVVMALVAVVTVALVGLTLYGWLGPAQVHFEHDHELLGGAPPK